MSLLATALSVVVDAALGGWLGAMAFFSFVGAPTAFAELDDDHAGSYVNATFPKYYRVGLAAGGLALAAAAGAGATGGFDPTALATMLGTAVAIALFAYSLWVLIPKMDAAGEDAFEQYHRQSVVLNGAAMVAVAASLVAANL